MTLEKAQEHLELWLLTEQKIATGGQKYRIADRYMERADLKEVGERIRYWSDMVNSLDTNG